jgi:hypothetical protein
LKKIVLAVFLVSVSAMAQIRGRAIDLGLDNTGATDVGAKLNAYCSIYSSSDTMPAIYLPPGTYLITTPVNCTGSSTNLRQFTLIGEGRSGWGSNGTVTFNCNTPGQTCFWINNSQASTGSYKGPRIEHVTFTDTSSSGNDYALLRITQFNNIELNDLQFNNSVGSVYSTGTVSLTNGSTTVTGTGTSWTSAMQWGRIQIGGNFYEINAVNSATQLTLTSSYTGTTASGVAYAIDYGGVGLMLEGDSATGFTQYGTVSNLFAFNNMLAVDMVGGPTTASGNSRIKFYGGYIDCHRNPDSGAFWIGKYNDTMDWNVSANNCAVFGQIESGHANRIMGEMENTGAFTVVTTCNGGTAAQSCTRGLVINADAVSTGHDNELIGAYIYNVGNAVTYLSSNSTTGYITSPRFRSNLNNYVWSDGSTGCSTTQTNATVLASDCVFAPSGISGLSLPVDQLTSPSTNGTLDFNQYSSTWRWGQNAVTTGNGLTIRDTTTNTGTGTLFTVQTYSGTSGMQPFNLQGAVNQFYMSRTGNVYEQATTAATSSSNVNSYYSALCGNIWNGSASTSDCFRWIVQEGSGANPISTYQLTHSGSTGNTQVDLTGVGLVKFGTEGQVVLSSGTATVNSVWASTTANIQLTNCKAGGTPGILSVGTITAGTSFVINSTSSMDTSTVCWSIH